MRSALWWIAIVAAAACASGPRTDGRHPSAYIVVFELYPDAAGRLQRLAVSRVLDKQSGRTVIALPSALYVDRARDSLAERLWEVTYERGEIQPVYVQCASSPSAPDAPSCRASE